MNKIRNQGKTNRPKELSSSMSYLTHRRCKQSIGQAWTRYLVDATKDYFVRGKVRSVLFVGKQKAAIKNQRAGRH